MQECCSESLGTLVTVAKLAWESTGFGSSFQRFRNSYGNRPGNSDKERDVAYLVKDRNKQFKKLI